MSMPEEFELYHPRYSDVVLVRQKKGADSNRWREPFIKDMESHPEDVRFLVEIFDLLTSAWDRDDFIYERLSANTKTAIGGLEGLRRILGRHPNIFRVGQVYVRRVDASDPLSLNDVEPTVGSLISRTFLNEENPYLSPLEVAKVFYYLAPSDQPCSITYLMDASSPAMQVALPPRVISIIQQFPQYFACSEESPGIYSVYKMKTGKKSSAARSEPNDSTGDKKLDDDSWQEVDDSWRDEIPSGSQFTPLQKEDVVQRVAALIPPEGVELSELLLWTSLPIQQAANQFYGSMRKMLETESSFFTIKEREDSSMVFRTQS